MNTKRVDISILRIMATLAVIFLHTNNTILNNTQNYQLSSENKFLMSVNISIMNWAVPMFLIITGALLLNKEIKGFVPSDVANEIVNEIKNHFAHNHYIVYSSVNTISKIQILQNERFAVNIKLNSEEEVEEAIAFNDNINSKDRHATRVLKMI